MDFKTMDASLQLDVDVMILDFLLHNAITALLQDATNGRDPLHPGNSLDAVAKAHDYLTIFNDHHPSPPDLADVQYRITLLQFTSLFVTRGRQSALSPSSTQLKDLRRKKARSASSAQSRSPEGDIFHSLGIKLLGCSKQVTAIQNVLILDLLPLFFELSSWWASSKPQSAWMHLAGELLLQAVLELAYKTPIRGPDKSIGATAIAEAFAWGYNGSSTVDEASVDLNALFWDNEGRCPSAEWIAIRNEFLSLAMPDGRPFTIMEAQRLSKGYPLRDFERQLYIYLEALALSPELPVLAQLHSDTMLGLSKGETAALKRRCGLSHIPA